MSQTRDKIISASRRTDIPGWYTPWFLAQIKQGGFTIQTPYNKASKRVDARPESVHSIVFWSKNFGPFQDLYADQILKDMGYHLYFNFTINSRNALLEPKLPGLSERLSQANHLCEKFGPDKLSWRFDPICFYRIDNKGIGNNLGDFTMIADAMAEMGISRCVTSFYNGYKKIETRVSHLSSLGNPHVCFIDPTIEKKQQVIQRMADYLGQKNIDLHLCCETSVFQTLGKGSHVKQNACIDGKHLKHLYGGTPETGKDYGQRSKLGCQCTKSIDIGAYADHPCYHNCLFCYANTGIDTKIRQGR
jgi:hypothetical protein